MTTILIEVVNIKKVRETIFSMNFLSAKKFFKATHESELDVTNFDKEERAHYDVFYHESILQL
jgi:hypothetical protein